MEGRIRFLDIPRVVTQVLDREWTGALELESILDLDSRARSAAEDRIALSC
ncbi:MAG: hypothetical protein LBQ30_08445 [Treponema sp.]|nr:hypothetical protein [Treponema sp.]